MGWGLYLGFIGAVMFVLLTESGLIVGILHRYTSAREMNVFEALNKGYWTLNFRLPLFCYHSYH